MQHSPEIAVAPMDLCGVPTNPMHEHLSRCASVDEMRQLDALLHSYQTANVAVCQGQSAGAFPESMATLMTNNREAFHAYNRAIWTLAQKYPAAEPLRSRDAIDLEPLRLGSVGIIMANSVNLGLRAVLAGSRYGVAPIAEIQEKSMDATNNKVRKYAQVLRSAHPVYRDFCALTPDASVGDYWHFIQRYEDDCAIVLEGDRDHFCRDGAFIGIVGPQEIRRAKGRSSIAIRNILRPAEKVVTASKGIDPLTAIKLMDQTDTDFLPILDGTRVIGVTSKASCGFHLRFHPYVDNRHGGLAYLLAVRHREQYLPLIRNWIEQRQAGVGFRIDRAHLDRGTDPFRYIDKIRELIVELDSGLELLAGNVATADGALRAVDAGATGVCVGIGPSPVCITRRVTHYGVPQITAIENVRNAMDRHGYDDVLVIADGGVTEHPGNVVAAKRAGAHFVMASTPFGTTRESAEEIEHFKSPDKRKHRIWLSGNASNAAQLDQYPHEDETPEEIFRRTQGPRKEGETKLVPIDPNKDTVRKVVLSLTDGETSGISYGGGDKSSHLYEYGESLRITSAGDREAGERLNGDTLEY